MQNPQLRDPAVGFNDYLTALVQKNFPDKIENINVVHAPILVPENNMFSLRCLIQLQPKKIEKAEEGAPASEPIPQEPIKQ